MCVKGTFTPTADAASLCKAPQFAKPVPLTGRFSMGGGNPMAPDNQKDNARGMALHFDIGGGNTTDLVMISAPVFLAKTPEQFVELLKTVAPGPDGKQDGDKIGAFFKAHPECTRQGAWLNARAVPASYASADYFGVHAFTVTNAKGEKHVIKWKVVPKQSEPGLSDDDAKTKGGDFYFAELKDRLAKGPVSFDLLAILGEPGDPEDDPTSGVAGSAQDRQHGHDLDHRSRSRRHVRRRHLRSEQSCRRCRGAQERQDPADALARLRRVVRPPHGAVSEYKRAGP